MLGAAPAKRQERAANNEGDATELEVRTGQSVAGMQGCIISTHVLADSQCPPWFPLEQDSIPPSPERRRVIYLKNEVNEKHINKPSSRSHS